MALNLTESGLKTLKVMGLTHMRACTQTHTRSKKTDLQCVFHKALISDKIKSRYDVPRFSFGTIMIPTA